LIEEAKKEKELGNAETRDDFLRIDGEIQAIVD